MIFVWLIKALLHFLIHEKRASELSEDSFQSNGYGFTHRLFEDPPLNGSFDHTRSTHQGTQVAIQYRNIFFLNFF